ncbi:NTP pyrophosphatase, house-cleaning of non-canonical NTPs [Paenibacillus aquistagni]|uniref:NTP pyrophosphatase, house-cleaning of non-canonical NTPs n=2 Tax=Paenibacillus aquistagni TaxID=1852522 RepID=A0A1X7JFW3_9BACL|nr:NTP pyrophosphatase, house-cleaning of non-canonical NTPs [Paenibacillus aquistagni]
MNTSNHKEFLDTLRKKPLAEMQREVDAYISQFKEGYFSPLALMARLTEEAGELAREVNHAYGEKPKKPEEEDNSIALELGDLLFILLCFANSLGIDLTKAHDEVMHKFNTRDADRWTRIDKEGEV